MARNTTYGVAEKSQEAVSGITMPFAQQLVEVAVGLEDARAAARLQARLERLDETRSPAAPAISSSASLGQRL